MVKYVFASHFKQFQTNPQVGDAQAALYGLTNVLKMFQPGKGQATCGHSIGPYSELDACHPLNWNISRKSTNKKPGNGIKINKKHISHKYGQIIPTTRESILHPFKSSEVPYNATNICFWGFRSFWIIPLYIPYPAIGVAYFPIKIMAIRSFATPVFASLDPGSRRLDPGSRIMDARCRILGLVCRILYL